MMSICLMMFGVYAASNPSVSISGQVSYTARDAKVLVLGKVNGQAGNDSNVDYPSVADAQNPTESSVSLPTQYLGYTKGESAGSTADNLPQWNMGTTPHAFYEDSIGIRPIVISFKMTNLSNYPVVATVDFTGVTDADLASKNLTRTTTGLEENKVYLNKNVTKEITITYAVANDAVSVNGDNLLNMSITFEKTIIAPTPSNVKSEQGETMQSDWEYEYDGNSFVITRYKKTRPLEGETFDASAVPTQVVIPSSVVCSDGKTYPVKKLGKVTEEQFKAIMSGELPESEMGNGPLFIDMSRVTDNTYLAALPSDIIVSEGIEVINPGALGLAFGVKTLPNSIKEIGSSSCFGTSITTINLPNLIRLGNSAFAFGGYASPITDFAISSGLTSFDDSFDGCSTLENITCAENCKITEISSDAFYNCQSLKTIQIPNSVLSIGKLAFESCSSLESVTFGENSKLVSIGQQAFNKCSALTTINIPNSVTNIGSSAFSGCDNLKIESNLHGNAYYIGNATNPYHVLLFAKDAQITSCQINTNTKIICSDAFRGCSSMTSVEIPNSVTFIGYAAFRDCSSMTSVEIPNSVTYIGGYAFYNCSSMTSVEIPNSVTYIGDYAFYNCSSMTSVEIPNNVTYIGDYAFSNCDKLKNEINLHGDVYYIGNTTNPYLVLLSAKDAQITSCQINTNTKFIHSRAFYNCSSLTTVEIPNSVTIIGEYAFVGCKKLKTESNLYDNAYYIGNASNPYLVLLSAKDAQITNCQINKNTKFIHSNAFRDCSSLTTIKLLAENPPVVADLAFVNCLNIATVYVPAASVEAYKTANYWSGFADMIQAMA